MAWRGEGQYRIFVALCAALLVACVQSGGSDAWKSDWTTFVSELRRIVETKPIKPEYGTPVIAIDAKAAKNTLQGQLFDKFSGEVRWVGRFFESSQGKLGIKMTESDSLVFKGYTLPNIVWVKLKTAPPRDMRPGDMVTFRARVDRPKNEHPFVGVLLIGSVIAVELIDGELE